MGRALLKKCPLFKKFTLIYIYLFIYLSICMHLSFYEGAVKKVVGI